MQGNQPRKGLLHKAPLEQKPKQRLEGRWEKDIPGRGDSTGALRQNSL